MASYFLQIQIYFLLLSCFTYSIFTVSSFSFGNHTLPGPKVQFTLSRIQLGHIIRCTFAVQLVVLLIPFVYRCQPCFLDFGYLSILLMGCKICFSFVYELNIGKENKLISFLRQFVVCLLLKFILVGNANLVSYQCHC